MSSPLDISVYATVWASLLFGAAFGAAASAVVPTRTANWALCVTFLLMAFLARPLIIWMTTP